MTTPDLPDDSASKAADKHAGADDDAPKRRPPAGQRARFIPARPPAIAPPVREEEPAAVEEPQEDYSTLTVAPAQRAQEESAETTANGSAEQAGSASAGAAGTSSNSTDGAAASSENTAAGPADSGTAVSEDPGDTGEIRPVTDSDLLGERTAGSTSSAAAAATAGTAGTAGTVAAARTAAASAMDTSSAAPPSAASAAAAGATSADASAAASSNNPAPGTTVGNDPRRPSAGVRLDNERSSRLARPNRTATARQADRQSTGTALKERPGGVDKNNSAGNAADGAATNNAKISGGTDSGDPKSPKHKPDQGDRPSDADVVRTGGSMAIATLLSRITGFLRTVLIGSALGAAVASAFNTANTLPNLITELVLGAVLTSLVVPVLVRAEKEDPDRGEAFIRRLITLTFTLTVVISVIAVFAAPLLIRVTLAKDGEVNVQMATAFAYLVLPQIFFYAMFAVFMAVLNTKGVFKPGAWAPVVNNVVTLVVLGAYLLLPDDLKLSPTDNVTVLNPNIILLGLGTTMGVVFQALIMVPYLKRAGINLKPLWGIDERLKNFASMGVAIVLYVLISQVGWAVNNQIASAASDAAPTIYMQAWQLLQMPYGVIGVTLLTAVMPRLSRNAADGDDKAVVNDLTVATRLTMFAMIPIIIFMTAFGTVLGPALFAYKSFSLEDANVLGWTVSFSSFTLIPYALVLLHLRVFYAREEVWTPTFIVAGITTTKIALISIAPFIATEPRLVVVLLGAANGFGFVAGAIIGVLLLKRSLGNLNSGVVMKTSAWATAASIVGALVAWQVDMLVRKFWLPVEANPWFLIRLVIAGIVFLLVTGIVLSRSKLQEVRTVGAAMSRLPVVGKFFAGRASVGEDENIDVQPMAADPINPAEAAREAAVANSLLPPLPPLSAGRVRGPRLVPGAPVLDGRYRLLADHGGSSASRFWQARNTATKDVVGLTILDPLAAVRMGRRPGEFVPNQSRRVMQAKEEMSNRSRAMKRAQAEMSEPLPGMARIRQVIDSPGSVVVISEWTDGKPLADVAETQPDPMAAGYAVADLADAAAFLHDRDLTLGVDHRDRIRISTDGGAVLAFPGYLPNNSTDQDLHGIAVALELLLQNVPLEEVPAELVDLYRAALAPAHQPGKKTSQEAIDERENLPKQNRDPRAMAAQLRYLTAGELDVSADATPSPEMQSTGFGSRRRAKNLVGAGAIAVVSALVIAAIIAAIIGWVGSDSEDSPLSSDSIRSGAQGVINRNPGIVPIDGVQEWKPEDGKGTLDAPQDAKKIADGDPRSVWRSDSYLNQLGRNPEAAKEGIGLLVDLPTSTRINALELLGLKPGTEIEFRRVLDSKQGRDKNGEPGTTDPQEEDRHAHNPRKTPVSLDQTELVATMDVTAPEMHVEFTGDDTEDFRTGEGESSQVRAAAKNEGVLDDEDTDDLANAPGDEPVREDSPARNHATKASEQLLIWITKLPPMDRQAQIGELVLLGTWEGQHHAGADKARETTSEPAAKPGDRTPARRESTGADQR